MKKIHIIRNSYAVAGVIEALLLVALVAIILSTIQLVYIPIIMKEKESEHMNIVENQFANLKSVIETQSVMGIAGSGSPIIYSPMSSPITLGGNELPYFISHGSRGNIKIIDKENTNCGLIVMDTEDLPYEYSNYGFPAGIPLTSLGYDATNFYFVDQNYILEGGAVILEQPEDYTIKVDIPMKVENHSNYTKIYYTIPVFNTPINKDILSGKENCFIRTNYIFHNYSVETLNDGDDDNLTIITDYADAWYESLTRDDSGVLWEYVNNGMINVSLDTLYYHPCVKIQPGIILNTYNTPCPIDIELTIVEIDIQVGPGYVIPKNN